MGNFHWCRWDLYPMPKTPLEEKKNWQVMLVRFVRPRNVIFSQDLAGSLAEILVAVCHKQVTEALGWASPMWPSPCADLMMHMGFPRVSLGFPRRFKRRSTRCDNWSTRCDNWSTTEWIRMTTSESFYSSLSRSENSQTLLNLVEDANGCSRSRLAWVALLGWKEGR